MYKLKRKLNHRVFENRPRSKDRSWNRIHRHEAKIDPENAVSLKSHTRGHGYARGYGPSIRTRPIDNFLHSRIGKPWNEVYSELCQMFTSKLERRELDRKLRYTVRQSGVVMINGKPHDISCCGWVDDPYRPRPMETQKQGDKGWRTLYVNPDTGILERIPYVPFKNSNRSTPKYIQLGDTFPNRYTLFDSIEVPTDSLPYRKYAKVDNVWYRVTLKPLCQYQPYQKYSANHWKFLRTDIVLTPNRDALYNFNQTTMQRLYDLYGTVCNNIVFAESKIQVGTREIKKEKLNERYSKFFPTKSS